MKYINDMLLIEHMEPNGKLHHYTSVNGLLGIIQGREFWATKWCFLNDQLEFSVGKKCCIELLTNQGINSKIIDRVEKEIDSIYPTFDDNLNYYVLSFSEERDSLAMWAGYAGQMGVCLGINNDIFRKLIKGKLFWEGRVIYDSVKQVDCIKKSIEKGMFNKEEFGNVKSWCDINGLSEYDLSNFVAHLSVICILYNMFFKKQCFSVEKEYRYIFTDFISKDNKEEILFRNKNGTIIPYIKKKFDNLSFVDEIIIGPVGNMDISLNGIKNLLQYNQCLKEVSKSSVPLRY